MSTYQKRSGEPPQLPAQLEYSSRDLAALFGLTNSGTRHYLRRLFRRNGTRNHYRLSFEDATRAAKLIHRSRIKKKSQSGTTSDTATSAK